MSSPSLYIFIISFIHSEQTKLTILFEIKNMLWINNHSSRRFSAEIVVTLKRKRLKIKVKDGAHKPKALKDLTTKQPSI